MLYPAELRGLFLLRTSSTFGRADHVALNRPWIRKPLLYPAELRDRKENFMRTYSVRHSVSLSTLSSMTIASYHFKLYIRQILPFD
jgi:hypothetical protein